MDQTTQMEPKERPLLAKVTNSQLSHFLEIIEY